MTGYVLILVWVAFVALVNASGILNRTEMVCGQQVRRMRPFYAVIVFLPLVIWAGFRGDVFDTVGYKMAFQKMPSTLAAIPAYMTEVTKDRGFSLFSVLWKCIFGDNVEVYFLIIAAIQAYFLIKVYRKYSPHYMLTFFLFIASTDYIAWMFNGMRQFLAVTIVFGCFEWILKKKYVPAIIVILLASQIHGSALLMIPFLFIAQGEAWNTKTLMFLVATVLAVAFAGNLTNLLDTALIDTQYKTVVSDWQAWEDDGTNVLRVLVYSVPALLSWFGRRRIKRIKEPVINLCTNMSIVSAGLYLMSMFTSGVFIGRLPIYFSLYSYILLPWEIDNLFSKRMGKMIFLAMMIGYLLFYYIHLQFVGG